MLWIMPCLPPRIYLALTHIFRICDLCACPVLFIFFMHRPIIMCFQESLKSFCARYIPNSFWITFRIYVSFSRYFSRSDKLCWQPSWVKYGVLGWLLVVVLFAPIRGGSLGICFVCWMLLRHCTEALVYSNHPRAAAASSYLAIIFGRIASGVPWFLRSTAEPMQHPHQCWRWCRLW